MNNQRSPTKAECYMFERADKRREKKNADEKNRTSTRLLPQASETCASTSSATSARKKGKANDTNLIAEVQEW